MEGITTKHRQYIRSIMPKIAYDAYFLNKSTIELSEMYNVSPKTVYKSLHYFSQDEVANIFKEDVVPIYVRAKNAKEAANLLFEFGISCECEHIENDNGLGTLVIESKLNN